MEVPPSTPCHEGSLVIGGVWGGVGVCLYIYKKKLYEEKLYGGAAIDILPEAKKEGREVTPAAEWQWPSCIASLKWREGGRSEGEGEGSVGG